MTQLEIWIQHPSAIALAKTLLHSLWQAGLVALTLSVCVRFIHDSRQRYAAACAALAVIVIVAFGTLLFLAPATVQPQFQRVTALKWLPSPDAPEGAPAAVPGMTFRRMLPWITPVWFLGVVLSNLWRAAGWAATQRLRRRSSCSAPETWDHTLNAIRNRMYVARIVALFESCRTQVPIVIGHFRPAILLPVGLLAGMPGEQVELILMHELAHIRRCDYLVNLLQTLIENVMFYNPAVWWISNLIRTERENCCDDVVVEATHAGPVYAAALAALEVNRSRQIGVVMAATGGSLVKRIRRILHQVEPQTSAAVPVLSAAAITLMIGGLLAAHRAAPSHPTSIPEAHWTAPAAPAATAAAAVRGTTQNPSPVPAQVVLQNPLARWVNEEVGYIITPEERAAFRALSTAEERERFVEQYAARRTAQNPAAVRSQIVFQSALARWLDQDVVYIITPEERAAFMALSTDAEREQFIEQFWLLRDPTPGTPENEYKDEHYRRIAYANQHFTSNIGLPQGLGWRMDRGRVYIMWGAPDEMETHPAGIYVTPDGATRTFPFEIWRYRFIQGVGNNVLLEFVDPNGTAEFKWTTDPAARK